MTRFTKNTMLILLTIPFLPYARAQQPARQQFPSLQKMEMKDTVIKKRVITGVSDPVSEITRKISVMMDSCLSYPNNKNTWSAISNRANNILLEYFYSGYLKGQTSKEAFFVKMGPETMSDLDLRNNRMILVAGIANKKPAEFDILRFEKTCTGGK